MCAGAGWVELNPIPLPVFAAMPCPPGFKDGGTGEWRGDPQRRVPRTTREHSPAQLVRDPHASRAGDPLANPSIPHGEHLGITHERALGVPPALDACSTRASAVDRYSTPRRDGRLTSARGCTGAAFHPRSCSGARRAPAGELSGNPKFTRRIGELLSRTGLHLRGGDATSGFHAGKPAHSRYAGASSRSILSFSSSTVSRIAHPVSIHRVDACGVPSRYRTTFTRASSRTPPLAATACRATSTHAMSSRDTVRSRNPRPAPSIRTPPCSASPATRRAVRRSERAAALRPVPLVNSSGLKGAVKCA